MPSTGPTDKQLSSRSLVVWASGVEFRPLSYSLFSKPQTEDKERTVNFALCVSSLRRACGALRSHSGNAHAQARRRGVRGRKMERVNQQNAIRWVAQKEEAQRSARTTKCAQTALNHQRIVRIFSAPPARGAEVCGQRDLTAHCFSCFGSFQALWFCHPH